MKDNDISPKGFIPYNIILFFLNLFINEWDYYNLNYFLKQNYTIINPSTFGKKISYDYDNIIYKPSVSVLICTYNRIESLKRTIQHLRNQKKNNYSSLEIVVINHKSTDGTFISYLLILIRI